MQALQPQSQNSGGSYNEPGLGSQTQPQKPDGSYYQPGLEVVPHEVYGGLQHDKWASAPQIVRNSDLPEVYVERPQTRRICGLKRRIFWIILVIVLVVAIGAGVGAGVGASMANKKSNDTASNAAANAGSTSTQSQSSTITDSGKALSASTPNPTLTSTSTTSAFALQTITSQRTSRILVRDCPSSNNTLYTYTSTSSTLTYRKRCSQDFRHITGHDEHTVNEYVQNLDICIDKCAQHNINNRDGIAAGNIYPCNAVCWRNTFDTDYPGHCFGFVTRNLTSSEVRSGASPDGTSFNVQDRASTICDSAAWVDPF